jgi:hypothetical protein
MVAIGVASHVRKAGAGPVTCPLVQAIAAPEARLAAPRRPGSPGRRLDQLVRPGHQPDHPVGRDLPPGQRADRRARAQHGDPVRNLQDLVHPVRDEDHGAAARGSLGHELEQPVARGHVERRRRFIEHQHVRIARQRAGDHARLALAERQRPGQGVKGRDAVEQRLGDLPGPAALLLGAQARQQHAVAAEPDVVQHRTRLDDEDFLENGGDPRPQRRARGNQPLHGAPGHLEPAGAGLMDARQYLHERALPRPVLAHDRVDLAPAQCERAGAPRYRGTKRLRYRLDAHTGSAGRLPAGRGGSPACASRDAAHPRPAVT